MVPKRIQSIVKKFKKALRQAQFPSMQVRIFGSYARNEARTDSDIDICLISKSFTTHSKEKYRLKATIIAYAIDPRIQVVTVHPVDLKTNRLSPLFSHIRKEAVAA